MPKELKYISREYTLVQASFLYLVTAYVMNDPALEKTIKIMKSVIDAHVPKDETDIRKALYEFFQAELFTDIRDIITNNEYQHELIPYIKTKTIIFDLIDDNYEKYFELIAIIFRNIIYIVIKNQDDSVEQKLHSIFWLKEIIKMLCFFYDVSTETDFYFKPILDFINLEEKSLKQIQQIRRAQPIASTLPIYNKIENKASTFYYWPFEIEKLELLYQFLLKEKRVAENNLFGNSFATISVDNKLRTTWIVTQTSAFALLYLLYKTEFYQGESIDLIAYKLFKFNGIRASWKSTQQNFRKFQQHIKNPEYLKKKHSKIIEIINHLDLKNGC